MQPPFLDNAQGSRRPARRRAPLPVITFPEDLPVSGAREEIARAIDSNQVVIVSGETGSGKTTQLPKICLSLGRGSEGLIGHTQPRRIAASSIAKRIAAELGTEPGQVVGYKIRFTDRTQPGASVKLMTDGILLAETQGDPLLRAYDTLIIDEAHERSLNIDFLLGYLKQLLDENKRPDLKVIITSATIDASRFAQHFATATGPAPIIEVSGRLYPVELRYRPVIDAADADDVDDRTLMQAIACRASAKSARLPKCCASIILQAQTSCRFTRGYPPKNRRGCSSQGRVHGASCSLPMLPRPH
jgi:ATP-dependent helicase HrpA